jgi:hypothetical protein
MASSSAVAVAARAPISRERMERMFYLIAGCIMLSIVAVGFQHFYLHGKASDGSAVTHQIMPLVFLHGSLMTAWIIAFVVQAALIVGGNRKLHMSLGIIGAVLAALLVTVGVITAVASVHYNPESYKEVWGARRFLSFMLINILGFGVLVGLALKYKSRPERHRPMMLLATLFVAGPAGFFRIPAVAALVLGPVHSMLAPWVPMLVLGVVLLVIKFLMTRSLDRYLTIGFVAVGLMCVLQCVIGYSHWWYRLAGFVTA